MFKNAAIGGGAITLLATSLLLFLFVILPGVTDSTPFNKVYFLQADTSGISGARDVTQWTYFYTCGSGNTDCSRARPAPAFGRYAWDARADNLPDEIGGSHGGHTTSTRYYYLWRFGWVLLLIALFFEVVTFFTGFLACCGRLGSTLAYYISCVALTFYSAAASLITVTFVSARNRFNDDDRSAKIGVYAFGFMWGSYAGLLISVILFSIGRRNDKSVGRKSSTRARSFDGRRVKDDYS